MRWVKIRDPSSGQTFDALILDAGLPFLVGDDVLRFAPGAVLILAPGGFVSAMAPSAAHVIAVGEEILVSPANDPGPLPGVSE